MNNVSSAALRWRRQQLVRALPPLEQIIRGSLIETYKCCGRSSCHCNNGHGHGPKRYLSTVARTGDRARLRVSGAGRCLKYDWVLEFDIKGLLGDVSYYTRGFEV